jgi:sodium pump decarboxylase gamma subunit
METLITGINFMLIGMGGVFLFLLVMVLAMSLMSRLLARRGDESPADSTARRPEDDEHRAVAAAAAFHRVQGRGR